MAHIARHGVEPEEVEEMLLGRHIFLRSRGGRYVILGRSAPGRYLCAAFVCAGGMARVITARDMTRAERRRYGRGI